MSTLDLLLNLPPSDISEEWELGIDEAGRGPVLGPMVYGCCLWPKSLKGQLASIGFADSKQLTEENREIFFENLKSLKDKKVVDFEYKVLTAEFISNMMLRKNPTNLNEISFNSAFFLIRSVVPKYNITDIYIDTVGNANSYTEKLYREFEEFKQLNFIVSEKADSKFPVVSAASIVAKVTRDKNIKEFILPNNKNAKIKETGSGYPSDPNTVKWLDDNFVDGFGYPEIVRFSWKTIANIFEKKKFFVKFNDEEEENRNQKLTDFFTGTQSRKKAVWIKNFGINDSNYSL